MGQRPSAHGGGIKKLKQGIAYWAAVQRGAPNVDCETCEIYLIRKDGSLGRKRGPDERPSCWRCPRGPVKGWKPLPAVSRWMHLYNLCHGPMGLMLHLPCAGGVMDQPADVMLAFNIMREEIERHAPRRDDIDA